MGAEVEAKRQQGIREYENRIELVNVSIWNFETNEIYANGHETVASLSKILKKNTFSPSVK